MGVRDRILYVSSGVVYREDTEQVLVVQDKYKVHLSTYTCSVHVFHVM